MSGFGDFFRRGNADESTPATQVEQRPVETNTGNSESEMSRMLAVLESLTKEVAALKSQGNTPAVADAPVVNAPVRDGWVDVSQHEGTLTQHPDDRVKKAAGYANSRLGGYPQYLDNGMFNVAEIESRRSAQSAGNGGSVAPSAPSVTTTVERPSPAANTPLATLAKQKRFSKLSVFLPTNKNHRHWSGTISLDDGTVLTLTDFPYDPVAAVAQNKGYIPATLQTAFTAYFGSAIRLMDGAGVPGGTRDQFSMAIARALNAKGNGQYVHALDGHRNVEDWLRIASEAIGR